MRIIFLGYLSPRKIGVSFVGDFTEMFHVRKHLLKVINKHFMDSFMDSFKNLMDSFLTLSNIYNGVVCQNS